MDPLQDGLQTHPENSIVGRAAEPALPAKLHVLYAAGRTGQSRQLFALRADVLTEQRLDNGRKAGVAKRRYLLLSRAARAKMQFRDLLVDDLGEMNRRLAVAQLALHGGSRRRQLPSSWRIL